MPYSFFSYGHPNITAKHKNTFEFTKDKDVSIEGDCIIGVNSNFDLIELKKHIKNKKEVMIRIDAGGLVEEVSCLVNTEFNDDHEIVVRKSNFKSERTLGLYCDKACIDFSRQFVEKLKENGIEIMVDIK